MNTYSNSSPFPSLPDSDFRKDKSNNVYEMPVSTTELSSIQSTSTAFCNPELVIHQSNGPAIPGGNESGNVYDNVIPVVHRVTMGSNSRIIHGQEQRKNATNVLAIIAIVVALIACTIAAASLVKTQEGVTQVELQQSIASYLELKSRGETSSSASTVGLDPIVTSFQTLQETTQVEQQQSIASSCLELKSRGETSSGVFTVRPDPNATSFLTFCDMTSGGGGWTLVASVHENNIDGKCTVGDKWSSEQGVDPSVLEISAWETFETFGTVESITSADYKNPAYYNLQATDLMLWHVPNNIKISDLEEKAFLKYLTTNGFLSGLNLRNVYNYTFSFWSFPMYRIRASLTDEVWLARLREQIPQFYKYIYDASPPGQFIQDGGGDMYDRGNEIFVKVNDEAKFPVIYGQEYGSLSSGYFATSAEVHPFMFLGWIDSTGVDAFSIQVKSNAGADGRGNISSNIGEFQQNGFTVEYRFFHIYNANDPSICEVYFYISNSQKWRSVEPTVTYPNWSSQTDILLNEIRFQEPRNVMVGYILLSRLDGGQIMEGQVVDVLRELLTYFEVITVEMFQPNITNYVAPIQFARGNLASIASRVPTSQVNNVAAGFIELNAIDQFGYTYALCPGVSMRVNGDPSLHCIGRGNTNRNGQSNPNCGDYSDWNRGNIVPSDSPSATGRSLQDIQSTILIFTRNEE